MNHSRISIFTRIAFTPKGLFSAKIIVSRNCVRALSRPKVLAEGDRKVFSDALNQALFLSRHKLYHIDQGPKVRQEDKNLDGNI